MFNFFSKRRYIQRDITKEVEKATHLRKSLLNKASRMATVDGENDWFIREEENKIIKDARVSDCIIEKRRREDFNKIRCYG